MSAAGEELLKAMRDLRADPAIAEVLGTPARYEASPSAAAPATPGSTSRTGISAANDAAGTPRYFSQRATDREGKSVSSWLQQHRDELSDSEARRVHNRLRSEHLAASSQLEIDSFRLEHETSMALLEQADEAANARLKSAAEDPDISAPFVRGLSLASATQTELVSSENDAQARGIANIDPTLVAHTSEYKLSKKGLAQPAPAYDTAAELGEIDQENNYQRKQLEVFGEGGNKAEYASRVDEASGVRDVPVPKPIPVPELSQRAQVLAGTAGSGAATFTRADVEALQDAIRQRDQTITRMERQLREEREFAEMQLAKKKSEMEDVRLLGESRVAALRQQIDSLVSRQEQRVSTADEDLKAKVESIRQVYERNIEDLRSQSSTALDTFHNEAERRIREVTERAETAIRAAKERYRVERTEIIGREKEKLMERIVHEQNVVLREAELQLRTEVEAHLLDKLKTDLERAMRSQLKTELLPMVHKQLVTEVKGTIMSGMKNDITTIFHTEQENLETRLKEDIASSAKDFVDQLVKEQQSRVSASIPSAILAGGDPSPDRNVPAPTPASGQSASPSARAPGDAPATLDNLDGVSGDTIRSQLNRFSTLMAEVEKEASVHDHHKKMHNVEMERIKADQSRLTEELADEQTIEKALKKDLERLGSDTPTEGQKQEAESVAPSTS